jgi:hypothetical protein
MKVIYKDYIIMTLKIINEKLSHLDTENHQRKPSHFNIENH